MGALPNEIVSHIISWLPGYLSFGTLYGTKMYDYHKLHDKKCEMFAVMNMFGDIKDLNKYDKMTLAKYLAHSRISIYTPMIKQVTDIIATNCKAYLHYCYKLTHYSKQYIIDLPQFDDISNEELIEVCLYDPCLIEDNISFISNDVNLLFMLLLHVIPRGSDSKFYRNDDWYYMKEEQLIYEFRDTYFNDDVISAMMYDPKYSWLGIRFINKSLDRAIIPIRQREINCPTIFHEFEANDHEIEYLSENPYYTYRYLLMNYNQISGEKLEILMGTISHIPKYMYDIVRIYCDDVLENLMPYILKDPCLVIKHTHLYEDSIKEKDIIDIINKYPKYAFGIIYGVKEDNFRYHIMNDRIKNGIDIRKHRTCIRSIMSDPHYAFKYMYRINTLIFKTDDVIEYEYIIKTILAWNEPNYALLSINYPWMDDLEKMLNIIRRSKYCLMKFNGN